MTISFNNIPANIRVPFFWAEVDASQAGYFVNQQRALLVGQMLATGVAAAGIPILVSSVDQAKAEFGRGSMLADMMAAYRLNDGFGEVWCLPLADPSSGNVKDLLLCGLIRSNTIRQEAMHVPPK